MMHVTDDYLDESRRRFRAEVHELLRDPAVEVEVAALRADPDRRDAGRLDVYRELGRRGWLAVDWPACFGGLGRTAVDKAVVTRALISHHVPDLAHVVAVDIVGTTLLRHGTDEQMKTYLPGLAAGELIASVLYSEPDAGSDLAALRTRAQPCDGGWRLYGRKIYSLKSHLADVAICAARTTSGEGAMHGITLFLLPLDTPGVRASALPSLSDDAFSEVILDGVVVTRDDVLGEVDDGWQLLTEILPLERTGVEFESKAAFLHEHLIAHLAVGDPTDTAVDTAAAETAHELVDLHASVRAAGLLSQRCVERLAGGAVEEIDSAVAKLHSTETHKALTRAAYDVLGATAAHPDPARPGDIAVILDHAHRDAPGFTLSAGTSEIMLQLLATAILGDPETDRPGLGREEWAAPFASLDEPEIRSALAGLDGSAPTGAPDPLWATTTSSLASWTAALDDSSAALAAVARAVAGTTLRAPLADARAARLMLAACGLEAGCVDEEPIVVGWCDTELDVRSDDAGTGGGGCSVSGRVEVELRGARRVLLAGPVAGRPGTSTVAVVDLDAAGVSRTPLHCVDDRARELLALDEVAVTGQRSGFAPSAVLHPVAVLLRAAELTGLAWTAHHTAVRRATRRRQFGGPIARFQAVAFALAAERVRLEVLQALVEDLAFRLDAGLDAELEALEVAITAADTARDVTTHSIQVHGAEGMRRDNEAHRLYLRATVDATGLGRLPRLRTRAAALLLNRPRRKGAEPCARTCSP